MSWAYAENTAHLWKIIAAVLVDIKMKVFLGCFGLYCYAFKGKAYSGNFTESYAIIWNQKQLFHVLVFLHPYMFPHQTGELSPNGPALSFSSALQWLTSSN